MKRLTGRLKAVFCDNHEPENQMLESVEEKLANSSAGRVRMTNYRRLLSFVRYTTTMEDALFSSPPGFAGCKTPSIFLKSYQVSLHVEAADHPRKNLR